MTILNKERARLSVSNFESAPQVSTNSGIVSDFFIEYNIRAINCVHGVGNKFKKKKKRKEPRYRGQHVLRPCSRKSALSRALRLGGAVNRVAIFSPFLFAHNPKATQSFVGALYKETDGRRGSGSGLDEGGCHKG